MNDTTRRFLTAIVERVPAGGRIIELRLFPAIRQGGMESGVAVVAVELAPLVAEPVDGAAVWPAGTAGETVVDCPENVLPSPEGGAGDGDVPERTPPGESSQHDPAHASDAHAVVAHELVDTDIVAEEEEGTLGRETPASLIIVPHAEAADDDEVGEALDEELHAIVVNAAREVVAAEARAVAVDDSPYADAPIIARAPQREIPADAVPAASPPNDPDTMVLSDILAPPSPTVREEDVDDVGHELAADAVLEETPIERLAILTASYRLVLKGPDRGSWEVDITHEADAPLATVERVARGVAKRSGDDVEPEHFSAASLREALDAPAWITTT